MKRKQQHAITMAKTHATAILRQHAHTAGPLPLSVKQSILQGMTIICKFAL